MVSFQDLGTWGGLASIYEWNVCILDGPQDKGASKEGNGASGDGNVASWVV